MTIYFNNTKLMKICNTDRELMRRFGAENAKEIRKRLSQIHASDNLAILGELRSARLHPLKDNRAGQFAVDVKHPKRIVFVPNHDPVPKKQDGSVDLEEVTQVLILEIVDYHD